MKVIFDKDKTDLSSGAVSILSFHHPAFKRAMNEMFGVKNNEMIGKLVLQDDGVKAYIETKG